MKPFSWEGNRRSGVADFSASSTYRLKAYEREMSTPPTRLNSSEEYGTTLPFTYLHQICMSHLISLVICVTYTRIMTDACLHSLVGFNLLLVNLLLILVELNYELLFIKLLFAVTSSNINIISK